MFESLNDVFQRYIDSGELAGCSLVIRHLPVARLIGTDPDYQAMLPQCSNGVINGRFAPMKHGNQLWLRQIRIIS